MWCRPSQRSRPEAARAAPELVIGANRREWGGGWLLPRGGQPVCLPDPEGMGAPDKKTRPQPMGTRVAGTTLGDRGAQRRGVLGPPCWSFLPLKFQMLGPLLKEGRSQSDAKNMHFVSVPSCFSQCSGADYPRPFPVCQHRAPGIQVPPSFSGGDPLPAERAHGGTKASPDNPGAQRTLGMAASNVVGTT